MGSLQCRNQDGKRAKKGDQLPGPKRKEKCIKKAYSLYL
ncbi:MAG: hypothetical protein RHS_2229 [Robinsoniella sp. RHS]|nr:MAG: hypothetical protein RHS_2229 [Robinsoniella sp. RHS]